MNMNVNIKETILYLRKRTLFMFNLRLRVIKKIKIKVFNDLVSCIKNSRYKIVQV